MRGSNYYDEWAIIGPPAKCLEMAFRWRAYDGPTLNAGLVALWFFRRSGPVLLRNPIFLWIFRGRGSGPPVLPPLDPRMDLSPRASPLRTYIQIMTRHLATTVRCTLQVIRMKRRVLPCIRNYWMSYQICKSFLQAMYKMSLGHFYRICCNCFHSS